MTELTRLAMFTCSRCKLRTHDEQRAQAHILDGLCEQSAQYYTMENPENK